MLGSRVRMDTERVAFPCHGSSNTSQQTAANQLKCGLLSQSSPPRTITLSTYLSLVSTGTRPPHTSSVLMANRPYVQLGTPQKAYWRKQTQRMNLTNWLRYWRASLVDIDRQQIQPADSTSLTNLMLETNALRQFYKQQEAKSTVTGDVPLDVVLAPFRLGATSRSNYRAHQARTLYPFWIPARLTKEGELVPPAGPDKLIPWLVRDVLEPTTRHFPVLSTLEAVDAALARWQWSTSPDWRAYWANAEAFYAQATGTAGWPADHATVGDEWSAQRIYTLSLPPAQGTAANLIALYQYLEKQPALPALLASLLRGRAVGPPFDPEAPAQLLVKGHYGQLSGNFPLSASQRGTMQTWLTTPNGDVLPVNGPPGTGKTTLLQSIVANLLVEKALLGQEAPRILASSTNNQAITNILDSFGREARVARWVPEVSSLGLYLTKRAIDPATGYQVQANNHGFYQAIEAEDGHYLSAAQAELLRQGATFFGKPFATPAALCDALHQSLHQQKARIDTWLELLPQLRDEYGRPWQAAQLRSELVAAQAQLITLEKFQVELTRSRANESSLTLFLARFLGVVRQKRQARYRLLVQEHCPYCEEVTVYDPEQLQTEVAHRLTATKVVIQRVQAALNSLVAFDQLAAQLRQEYAGQATAAPFLAALSAAEAGSVHNVLDVTLRHRAFLLALHYWEARYVLALREKLHPAKPNHSPFEARARQYARWAMLTPCFISTCHSVAGFMKIKERGEDGYALDYFDLLLVDEAGQVSPEVGAAVFALARRAVVVGDTYQIEPVWSLSAALDAQNQRRAGLDPATCPEAYHMSAGSLMQLAQAASPVQLPHYPQARGLLLRQHRRCKPGIIRYCDEFVYGGQLERLGNPSAFASLGLPPLGYLHIAGECLTGNGSRYNPQEAEAIAHWLLLKKTELLAAAQRQVPAGAPPARLQDIVAVVTPFSPQRTAIQQELQRVGLAADNITVGTVHALQGAERPIILFSSVYDASHRGGYFFDRGYNLLNVAVSRAKEAFLVFGNRCLFNPSLNTPSGNLAKLLFEEPADEDHPRHELDNSFFYGDESRRHLPVPREYLPAAATGQVNRLSTLAKHRDALAWAINTAQEHLVIVSPFISTRAVHADGLTDLIAAAKARRPNLRITVYTDAYLDAPNGRLHPNTQAGRDALARAGAEVKIAAQIHNKTICLDHHALLEGSFNWLSASRSEGLARYEVSWFFRGEAWGSCIEQLVQEMESRVVDTVAATSPTIRY